MTVSENSDDGTSLYTDSAVALVYYSAYSPPNQPSLYATSDHAKVKLFWNNAAENSIDDLTNWGDFHSTILLQISYILQNV